MDRPVFALAVVRAQVAGVSAGLIHIGQVDTALALDLQHQYRSHP